LAQIQSKVFESAVDDPTYQEGIQSSDGGQQTKEPSKAHRAKPNPIAEETEEAENTRHPSQRTQGVLEARS